MHTYIPLPPKRICLLTKHSSKFTDKNILWTRPQRTTQYISKHTDHKATFQVNNTIILEINKRKDGKDSIPAWGLITLFLVKDEIFV